MAFTPILVILTYVYIHNLQDPESSPDSSHRKIKSPSPESSSKPNEFLLKRCQNLHESRQSYLICSLLSLEQSFLEAIIKPYEGTSLIIGKVCSLGLLIPVLVY